MGFGYSHSTLNAFPTLGVTLSNSLWKTPFLQCGNAHCMITIIYYLHIVWIFQQCSEKDTFFVASSRCLHGINVSKQDCFFAQNSFVSLKSINLQEKVTIDAYMWESFYVSIYTIVADALLMDSSLECKFLAYFGTISLTVEQASAYTTSIIERCPRFTSTYE